MKLPRQVEYIAHKLSRMDGDEINNFMCRMGYKVTSGGNKKAFISPGSDFVFKIYCYSIYTARERMQAENELRGRFSIQLPSVVFYGRRGVSVQEKVTPIDSFNVPGGAKKFRKKVNRVTNFRVDDHWGNYGIDKRGNYVIFDGA